MLAIAYYRADEFEDSKKKLNSMLKAKIDNHDEINYYLGLIALKEDELDNAKLYFKTIADSPADSQFAPEAILRLADIDRARKDMESAKLLYQKVADNYPKSTVAPYAIYSLGECFNTQGNRPECLRTWAMLVDKYPLSNLTADINFQIAESLVDDKNYQSAQKAYKTLVLTGNYASAIDIYEDMLKSSPLDKYAAQAQTKIAETLLMMGKQRQSAAAYQMVVDKYPGSELAPKALDSLISIWGQLKEYSLAKQATETLLEKYPKCEESAKIFLLTAKDSMSAGKNEEAVDLLRKASEAYKGEISAEAQKMIGDSYYTRGLYKEATVEYLKTVYLFRAFPSFAAEAQFQAAKACETANQKAEALRAYKRTIEFFPNTLWAAEAEKCLKDKE
jgi:TolA-binding protein